MLPKIEACATALRAESTSPYHRRPRSPSILLELFTNRGNGTEVVGDHTVEKDS
jgi:acetylglutamate kinase